MYRGEALLYRGVAAAQHHILRGCCFGDVDRGRDFGATTKEARRAVSGTAPSC